MLQIRKDYIRESFVIVATERGKRPHEFASKEKKQEQSPKENCPFCPENEHMILGVIDEIKDGDSWSTRAIWNKYKAAAPQGSPDFQKDNEFYTFADSVGEHEVVIETPEHGVELEDLDEEKIADSLKLIIKRVNDNYSKNAAYVSVFKNKGDEAGASLSHAHHQIVSYNLFPKELEQEIEIIKDYKGKNGDCPYCRILWEESKSDRRILEDEHFAAFSPYASRFSMEAWILPKKCLASITELSDDEINSLAKTLKGILKKLGELNSPPYNIFYRIARNGDDYHFRLEIAPRLAKWAGFEYTTGTIINTVTPEDAAKFYRGEE